jgi:hypothetical protein
MNSIQESKLLSGRRRKRRRHSRSPSKMSSKRSTRRRKLKRRLKPTQPPKLKMVMPRQRRPPRKPRDSPVKSTEPQSRTLLLFVLRTCQVPTMINSTLTSL